MRTEKIDEILKDPCTPSWAKRVIEMALVKDPLDALSVLEVITEAFRERLKKFMQQDEVRP